MIWKIAAVLVVLLVGVLAFVVIQPADYRVERSATMVAAPSAVFDQVDDFHHWDAWSPWDKLDPAALKTYSGPPAGPGAIYTWAGNDKMGQGRMTVTDTKPSEFVGIKLEFMKPFAAICRTEFTFKPAASGTTVVWTMTGHNNFMAKAAGLFMNMDKMIGGDFDRGLAQLKALVEAKPTTTPAG